MLAHVRNRKPLAGAFVSGSRQFRLGAEPQVIREQDGDEQQGGQRQSPSLGPLRLGKWLLVLSGCKPVF